jgi:hypothetical protein
VRSKFAQNEFIEPRLIGLRSKDLRLNLLALSAGARHLVQPRIALCLGTSITSASSRYLEVPNKVDEEINKIKREQNDEHNWMNIRKIAAMVFSGCRNKLLYTSSHKQRISLSGSTIRFWGPFLLQLLRVLSSSTKSWILACTIYFAELHDT